MLYDILLPVQFKSVAQLVLRMRILYMKENHVQI